MQAIRSILVVIEPEHSESLALKRAKLIAKVTDAHLRRVAPPALRHRLRRNPLDDAGSTVRVERALAELLAA